MENIAIFSSRLWLTWIIVQQWNEEREREREEIRERKKNGILKRNVRKRTGTGRAVQKGNSSRTVILELIIETTGILKGDLFSTDKGARGRVSKETFSFFFLLVDQPARIFTEIIFPRGASRAELAPVFKRDNPAKQPLISWSRFLS